MSPSPGLSAKPVIGYCDPWSVLPGEPVTFMVSTSDPTFEARVVRVRHGDQAPGGPGVRVTRVPNPADGTYPGADQPILPGSYLQGPPVTAEALRDGATFTAWVYPTRPDLGLQGLVTAWSDEGTGLGLFLEPGGRASLRHGERVVATTTDLRPREWAFVAATWDRTTGDARVTQWPQSTLPDDPATGSAHVTITAPPAFGPPLLLGGHVYQGGARGTYNGRLDTPRVYGRALGVEELVAARAGGTPVGLVADWDFVTHADSVVIRSRVPGGPDAIAVHHPAAGVPGHAWTGSEGAFFRAPDQFNALHFHTDDLEDAGWTPSFTVTMPEGTPSGVYAVQLRSASGEDVIPFFVRAATGLPKSPVVFLAPTMSYLAYANEHSAAEVHAENAAFDITAHFQAEDHYAMAVPVSGLYDRHPDGTGVWYSSWRKPIVSMRPSYHLPVARSAHQLSADLHIVDWLEEKEIAYDLVTDHDLHSEGADLLNPYRVVITGSHPEYWTERMLDALEAYLARGGRLVYMGANGFYWVTSVSPSRPHLIEVRRGRRGTASWRNEPGEDHHSTTGELGGLWRDRGRAPQRVAGVGMTAQGFGPARPYRRTPESRAPELAWIFDGVGDDEEIGTAGLVLGAAGGFEMDRADRALGTPVNATVLAVAAGFGDDYQHVVEEVTTSDSKQGGTVSPFVRADMVYVPRANGGAVFATGSIAFSGALSHNRYDNPASRIVENVLRRFVADTRTPALGRTTTAGDET
ncbi:N,N-dimethylformamidase [Pseudonocardia hierapolitana]|uniref:N,N-dimethylformamidase n=1 Tax=Pseudonocardia hierapolitana TaxID=1128676 RepID=A0A561SJG0_9PSEU|nr:N,N-dimethylformamidase beta subunit family domain-containing protein [Pseudonocardia hierapolitana]TWF75010.1 N,N-dimethylformamidase [Pseudonocardia hierapolitana]